VRLVAIKERRRRRKARATPPKSASPTTEYTRFLTTANNRRRMALERKQQGPGRPASIATARNVGTVTPRDKQPAA
jgi:hypothetical protein